MDLTDINPFVAALSSPEQYAGLFPGLEGSMEFYGDANCNGTFDWGDINPFVIRVTTHFCDCGEMDGEPPIGPVELASALAANVAPELYDDLVTTVKIGIDWQETKELQDYWQAVYTPLTQ